MHLTAVASEAVRRLRRLRLTLPSIRLMVITLIALLGMMTVPFGWRAYRQKRALDEFDRLWIIGCHVGSQSETPTWLSDRLPKSWAMAFDRVEVINLAMDEAGDHDLRVFADLPHVRRLLLPPNRRFSMRGRTKAVITDRGLDHLSGLSELEELVLDETSITDAGLLKLASLQRLKRLSVRRTRVTVAGARSLRQALPGVKIVR